jgi:hypothetical protein
MKKTILYIGSFALVAFIGLTAFSDAQTDDQKIEAKYQEMVTNFKAEKAASCKMAAVSTAEAQYQATMNSMGATDAGTTTSQPAASSGSSQPAVKPTTGGSSPVISSATKPVDNVVEEAPTVTKAPTNPQSERGGGTADPEAQKGRGGGTAAPNAQKGRGGAVND